MKTFATVAIAGLIAAPLSAQGTVRDRVEQGRRTNSGTTVRDRVEQARDRIETTRGGVLGGVLSRTDSRRGSSKVPPGHRPPAGMCRVWIDGVPPGHQPAVTDCTTARIEAARTANSRVIYGDSESFRGKGKGKFKNRNRTSDENLGIFRDRRVNDDDDRFDDNSNRGRGNGKAKGKKGRG